MTLESDDLGFDLTAWEAPPAPAGIADGVLARMRIPAAPAADETGVESREARRSSVTIAIAAVACIAAGTATYVMTRVKDTPTPVASAHMRAGSATAQAPTAAPPAPPPDPVREPVPAGVPAPAIVGSGAPKPPAPVVHRPVAPSVADTPKSLDRDDIAKAMATLKSQLGPCAQKSTSSGKVKIMVSVRPDGKVRSFGVSETYDRAVSSCIVELLKNLQFPVTEEGGTFTYPFVLFSGSAATGAPSASGGSDDVIDIKACDAKAAIDRGMQQSSLGEYADALASYEDAMKCKGNDAQLKKLAFMASCNSKNAFKAHLYYGQLKKDEQTRLIVMCTRNGIDPKAATPPPPPPMACDAQALKDSGMEHINLGEHADAARDFETAYRCRADATLPMIIATESCAAGDAARAKLWYGRLPPADQAKVAKACAQAGVKVIDAPRTSRATPSSAAPSGTGYLEVRSTPAAKVLVDGVDTGLTTPTAANKIALSAGKHKVTLAIGGDRFTYPVTIQPGAALILDKILQ